MAENEHQSREWSINIDQDNNLEEILEVGPDCCIYKVPQQLRKINEEAYTPCFISIGPLHYGRKELMGMESQKRRYWTKFEERVGEHKLAEFKTYVKNQEQRIRNNYSVTSKLQREDYIKVILHDVVFIIELFMRNNDMLNDRGHNDFLLRNAQHIGSISQDLLLLENQIPYFVLNHLYSLVFPSSEGHSSFFALFLMFFKDIGVFNWSFSEQPQFKHFTDFLRCAAVGQVQTVKSYGDIIDLPCATKLKKSGLEFKRIDHPCLHKISLGKRKLVKWLPWFGVNELQIPQIIISDEIEQIFRNLMALEIFHYPTQTYVCHYADLMDHLIDTNKDVDLLVEKEIIVNWVGDIEKIATMFNRLIIHITIRDSPYYEEVEKMKAHYKYPCNHLKATLRDVYFSDLWTGTATLAATFLLILTLLQTIYSIKQQR